MSSIVVVDEDLARIRRTACKVQTRSCSGCGERDVINRSRTSPFQIQLGLAAAGSSDINVLEYSIITGWPHYRVRTCRNHRDEALHASSYDIIHCDGVSRLGVYCTIIPLKIEVVCVERRTRGTGWVVIYCTVRIPVGAWASSISCQIRDGNRDVAQP